MLKKSKVFLFNRKNILQEYVLTCSSRKIGYSSYICCVYAVWVIFLFHKNLFNNTKLQNMNIQNSTTMHRHRAARAGFFFALLAIVAGALILVFNTGAALALYKPVIFSWPMLITIIGFYCLVSNHRFSFSALYITIVGLFLLIPRIEASGMTLLGWDIPQHFASTYWPVLLIVAGMLGIIYLIVRPRRKCRNKYWKNEGHYSHYTHHNFKKGGVNTVFGSGKHIILDPLFEGGEVNAVFGEVTLDLRKAGLPEGKSVVLEVNIVFGNAIILVPEKWNISVHATPVAGAFVDNRDLSNYSPDMSCSLDIHVNSVFSGGELRN